jgi:hypothetical protein
LEVKGRWVLILISVNLLVLVALAFVYPNLMLSPGPLVADHAKLATDCFACHAPFRGAASDRCVACHGLPDIGVRTTKGVALAEASIKTSFHQELIVQDCMACHSDHQGANLVQRSHRPFSHALLRSGVRDRCALCHAAPADSLHRQFKGNCGQCHSPERWKPAAFYHDKFFVLDKDHNATCATCHANDDFSHYTCYGCHEHQPENMRAKHVEEGIRNFENCVECHRSAHEESREGGSGGRRERD